MIEEKTPEEQTNEAEDHLERMEYEEDDAEEALYEARDRARSAAKSRDRIQERIDAPKREARAKYLAAILARATGPQEPIGDRVVRTSCACDEIPPELEQGTAMGEFRGLGGDNGDKWATNGHWMIRVDSVDGLPMLKTHPSALLGSPGERLDRADTPRNVGAGGDLPTRRLGDVFVDIRYSTFVEDAFPECAWHACSEADRVLAVVNGETVAVVMCVQYRRQEAS